MIDRGKTIRKPVVLKLGKQYVVRWAGSKKIRLCVLIQPTEKGYNFLDIDTKKCVLKQHLYRSKAKYHKDDTYFWLNERLELTYVDERNMQHIKLCIKEAIDGMSVNKVLEVYQQIIRNK